MYQYYKTAYDQIFTNESVREGNQVLKDKGKH